MRDVELALKEELRDAEYAEGYADSFLNAYIATQIKILREQRRLSPSDLAAQIGLTERGVVRLEDVNRSTWSLKTLKKLAHAYAVRLKISFETFGSLPNEVIHFNRRSLERVSLHDDPQLRNSSSPEAQLGRSRSSIPLPSQGSEESGYSLSGQQRVMRMPGEDLVDVGLLVANQSSAEAQHGLGGVIALCK
jgi:transcriptional regulator with XRE-family HTH domain